MIDSIGLNIPFLIDSCIATADGVLHLDFQLLSECGVKLESRNVDWGELTSGVLGWKPTDMSCPYESIPSSYAGIAMKISNGNQLASPMVNIKCSPAKILQGHNVFGPTDIELCAMEMLETLAGAFPELGFHLDWDAATISHLDVTMSARVPNPRHQLSLIQFLKNVSSGQMRRSVNSDDWETTCYLTPRDSKKRVLKAYLKAIEMQNELNKLRSALEKNPNNKDLQDRIAILSNEKLIAWAKELVRFEARIKKDWLRRRDYPLNLIELIQLQREYTTQNRCLVTELWSAAFGDLLNAMAGEGVNMNDHEKIHEKLRAAYFSFTPKGNVTYAKADRLYIFYRALANDGWNSVYRNSKRNTFGRNIKALCEGTGLSKAHLQNLRSELQSNVIPFCEFVKIDFNSQRPDWYVEPVSRIGSIDRDVVPLHAANY